MSDLSIQSSFDLFNDYQNVNKSTSALDSSFWDYIEDNDISVNQPGEADELQFEDYMNLMVMQLQSQTIDNTMDSSAMLNQLVQMSSVQMMSSLVDSVNALTQASTLTYAASLVGKTVTVGSLDEDGNMQEIVGTVTGTGTYQDTPVIFVDDEMYALSDIMAVGTLPPIPETETPDDSNDGSDTNDGETGETQQP